MVAESSTSMIELKAPPLETGINDPKRNLVCVSVETAGIGGKYGVEIALIVRTLGVEFAKLPTAGRAHRALADAETAASLVTHLDDELRGRYKIREVSHHSPLTKPVSLRRWSSLFRQARSVFSWCRLTMVTTY